MIKKLISVLVVTLALNFIAVIGAALWVRQAGHVDKAKFDAIKEILFPPADPGPTTKPSERQPSSQPHLRLDAVLAKYAGKRAGEQAQGMQATFDAQSALLERQHRELDDLQAELAREKERLARESAALESGRTALADREQQSQSTQQDKGFDDSLKLYTGMQPKQVKAVFMTLPEDVVVKYLTAMTPRASTKIVKEFKTPDELARVNRVLERMRLGKPATQPAFAGEQPTEAK